MMTGAEIMAALGDGTVDPRDVIRLFTDACEAVRQVEAENAAKAKADAEAAERKATISRLQAISESHRKAEREEMEQRHKAERKSTDGTTSRTLAAQIADISTRANAAPDNGDGTVMEG